MVVQDVDLYALVDEISLCFLDHEGIILSMEFVDAHQKQRSDFIMFGGDGQ